MLDAPIGELVTCCVYLIGLYSFENKGLELRCLIGELMLSGGVVVFKRLNSNTDRRNGHDQVRVD